MQLMAYACNAHMSTRGSRMSGGDNGGKADNPHSYLKKLQNGRSGAVKNIRPETTYSDPDIPDISTPDLEGQAGRFPTADPASSSAAVH